MSSPEQQVKAIVSDALTSVSDFVEATELAFEGASLDPPPGFLAHQRRLAYAAVLACQQITRDYQERKPQTVQERAIGACFHQAICDYAHFIVHNEEPK